MTIFLLRRKHLVLAGGCFALTACTAPGEPIEQSSSALSAAPAPAAAPQFVSAQSTAPAPTRSAAVCERSAGPRRGAGSYRSSRQRGAEGARPRDAAVCVPVYVRWHAPVLGHQRQPSLRHQRHPGEDGDDSGLTCTAKDGSTTAFHSCRFRHGRERCGHRENESRDGRHRCRPVGDSAARADGRPRLVRQQVPFRARLRHPARRKHAAGAVRKWALDPITKPGVLVTEYVEGPVSNGPNEQLLYAGGPGHGGWSGAIDYNWSASGQTDVITAVAEFIVPEVFAESSIGNYSSASTWAGLGGWNNKPLWQAGVDEHTQTVLWVETSSYNAWWQLAPNVNEEGTYSVNNGDDVESQVWICDITNNYYVTDSSNPNGYLCVWLHDYTNNQTTSGYWPSNNAGTWPSAWNTGEAIQEWNNGGSNDYAQFNPFEFRQAWDYWYTGNTYGVQQNQMGSSDSTSMAQIGTYAATVGGSCMANQYGTCKDSGTYVSVWWNAHQ